MSELVFPPRANPIELRDGHAVLFIRRRTGEILECLIDCADIDLVRSNGYRWCAQSNRCTRSYYATSVVPSHGPNMIGMHRLILGFPAGLDIDHKNHNTLDNRRENIRAVPRHINGLNKVTQVTNTSGFRGVTRAGNRWRATIWCQGRRINLGIHATKEEAAEAFRLKCIEIGGFVHK